MTKNNMAKWEFSCIDNGGKRQHFTIMAPDYTTAMKEGFKKADKKAKGDIISWECHLNLAYLTLA